MRRQPRGSAEADYGGSQLPVEKEADDAEHACRCENDDREPGEPSSLCSTDSRHPAGSPGRTLSGTRVASVILSGRPLPLRGECFAVPERVVRLVEVEQHDRHEHRLATGEGLRDCAEV